MIPAGIAAQADDRHHLPHADHDEMVGQRATAQREDAAQQAHAQDRAGAVRDELDLVPVAVQLRRDAGGELVEPGIELVARPVGRERAMIGHEAQQPGHDQLVEDAAGEKGADADADQRTGPEGQQQRQQQRRDQRQQQRDQHRQDRRIEDGDDRTAAQFAHPAELHQPGMAGIGASGAPGEGEGMADPDLADQVFPAEIFIVGLDPGAGVGDGPDRAVGGAGAAPADLHRFAGQRGVAGRLIAIELVIETDAARIKTT